MEQERKYDLSIILIAYNEENFLENCIYTIINTVRPLQINYEIVVVENGSTDKTFQIAKKLSEEFSNISCEHLDEPNPAGAMRRGYFLARGKTIINLDVDLSTDMKYFESLYNYSKEFDLVTGSRYMDKKLVKRTLDRLILSVIFNRILINGLLGSKIKDNNCGFRAIRRDVGVELFNEIKDDNVFGIVELIVRAQKNNFLIKEFPVEWKENPRRIGMRKILKFLIPALRLWFRLRLKI